MPGVSLHDLIEALANSVTEAQDRVERFQIANLSRYFDENQRPVRVEMRVPSLRPSAVAGEEDVVSVPLLALVGAVRLAIKDVEISMEVDVGDLTSLDGREPSGSAAERPEKDPSPPAEKSWGWGAPFRRKGLTVDVQSPRSKDQPAMARVTLRVASQEPTEGLARLLLLLNQRIGPIGERPSSNGAGEIQKDSK